MKETHLQSPQYWPPFDVNVEWNFIETFNLNFITPQKGTKKKILDLAFENAKNYYNEQIIRLKRANPLYHRERIVLMALKKTTIVFAKYIYRKFNEIAILEEYERRQDEGK